MTIGAIGSAVKSRPALIFPQGVEKVDLAWQSDRYMVIPARVNDQPLSLLFNTNYAITAIDRDVAHAAGIKSFDTTVMHLGLKDVVAAVSIPYDLRFGSMVLTNTKVHIIDLSWLRAALGIHIDGVIGYDLLSQGVVQIDSRSRRIAILNPQTFHYNGSGESIQISVLHGMPSVAATIKIPGHEAVKDNFWLNPGVPPMGVNHPLIRASTSGPPIAPNRFVIGTIEYIQLGKFKLEHLPSMCCTGTDTVDRLVGSVALSRFNVIFDYPHSRVILEQRE